MKDFEGWQGRNDYKGYIENLFDDNLATKFLQHYKVMKWVDGEPTTVGGAAWTPEKEITLQDDEKENTVVVTRKSTDGASEDYTHRIMTFNGRTIMDGEKYLIPWFWDANGKELAAKTKNYITGIRRAAHLHGSSGKMGRRKVVSADRDWKCRMQ